MLADDRWLGVVLEARKLSRLSLYTKDPLTLQREGMSLLLAGTNEGHVALIDPNTGDLQFHIKVHKIHVTKTYISLHFFNSGSLWTSDSSSL